MDILKWALLLFYFIRVSGNSPCQDVRSGFVLIDSTYHFPCDASNCKEAKLTKPQRTVGGYRNQVCWIENNSKEEDFGCEDNQLVLKQAKYYDQGSYMFICNGAKNQLKLDVLYTLKVNAVQTESVTLRCYAEKTNSVTWLYNNKSILDYEMGGSINHGEGFEGRVSLEKNCFKSGNFSLTITNLSRADIGIYRCFVDGSTKGYPHAYELHIDEKRDQTACISSDNHTILIIVIVVQTVIILVLGALLYRACYPTSGQPSEVNPRVSIQESSTTSTKQSSSVTPLCSVISTE